MFYALLSVYLIQVEAQYAEGPQIDAVVVSLLANHLGGEVLPPPHQRSDSTGQATIAAAVD